MIGIIVGAGRIGYNLAKNMSINHDITIIDKDKEICEKILDQLDCYVIQGSATNTKVLEEADVGGADFFVTTTANDEVNLLSSVYAKDTGVEKIVARLNNIDHTDIFRKLEIPFINSEISVMKYIARNIVRPTAQSLVSVGKGDAEIIELVVKNNDILFTPIKELQRNNSKFIIISIHMNDEDVIIPTSETELGYNDSITVLVKKEYVQEVSEYFTSNSQ